MTELSKQIVKDLRVKLMNVFEVAPHTPTLVEEDLKALDDNYDITVGNASFDSQEVTFKLTLRLKNAERKESMDLNRYADLYNVEPQKVADVHGIKYKLVGYRVKARKQPFIVLNLTNNKEYLFTEDLGRKHFKKGEVA
jgi:RecB family endonuclease NucS